MQQYLKLKIRLFTGFLLGLLVLLLYPVSVQAAGMSVSGGGAKVVGQNFTVTVTASGAEFDALQGTINVSGPVSVVSFSSGGATWLPGKSPSNGNAFVGIVNPTTKVTVTTITLKGTKEGKGSVSVGGVKLARNGAYVGSDGGSASFTISRAPTPPGGITISSSTHPDPAQAYIATTANFEWTTPSNGATGYAYVFNETADTTPDQKVNTSDNKATIENITVGEHYFHVRAQNKDGWGTAAHFKIVVKEPDAAIDASLIKPKITEITKTSDFVIDTILGTVSGISIRGEQLLAGYTLQAYLEPKSLLPAEFFKPIREDSPLTPLMAIPDAEGHWQLVLTQPIPAGFYSLTVQGTKDKILSPLSDPVRFELSVARGGSLSIITAADKIPPIAPKDNTVRVLGMSFRDGRWFQGMIVGLLVLLGLVIGSQWLINRYLGKRQRASKEDGRVRDIVDKTNRRLI